MTDDHLQLGESVKHASGDDAQRVQARFHAKAVNGAIQTTLLKRLDHVARQRVGVQVDGHIVCLGSSKDVPEFAVRQILALRMRIDDDGIHAQLCDPAFDLFGCCCRVLRCNGDHACETRWVAAHGLGQLVVGQAAERHGSGLVHDLNAGRCERDHLAVDACLVHVLQTNLIKVLQATHDVLGTGAGAAHVKTHQAFEAGVNIAVRQQLAVDVQHFRWRKGFFGCNALIAHLGGRSGGGWRWFHDVSL